MDQTSRLGQTERSLLRKHTLRPDVTMKTPPPPLLLVVLLSALSVKEVASSSEELPLDVRPAGLDPVPPRPYVAAVLEFAPYTWNPFKTKPWADNLEIVIQQAETAAAQGADVMVVAEYSISSEVVLLTRKIAASVAAELPQPEDLVIPCIDSDQHQVLSELSCLAKKHRMYIVANYIEKVPCTNDDNACPSDNLYLFNTNIVLDRNGTFIQRYRKRSLYGFELKRLQTPKPQLAAFRTDFGVDIGLMTCFDILFEVPAVELTRRGIHHFAFPTDWRDQLPSLTALQMHSAWPRGLGVTLLSSGYHKLRSGSLGSGVFTGHGFLNYTYNYSSDESVVVTALVPVSQKQPNGTSTDSQEAEQDRVLHSQEADQDRVLHSQEAGQDTVLHSSGGDDYYPVKHYNISEFVSAAVTGESQLLCDGNFCCKLEVQGSPSDPDPGRGDGDASYRLIAFGGRRKISGWRKWRWRREICMVMLCADGSHESCNVFPRGPAPPIPPFTLSGTFNNDTIVFPSVIQTHMRLATGWDFDRSTRLLSVTNSESLLSAQLYGRNYALDPPKSSYRPRHS